MAEVEIGQCAQSPAFARVMKPALRRKAGCVRKQVFIAPDSVQISSTVRLHLTQQRQHYVNSLPMFSSEFCGEVKREETTIMGLSSSENPMIVA